MGGNEKCDVRWLANGPVRRVSAGTFDRSRRHRGGFRRSLLRPVRGRRVSERCVPRPRPSSPRWWPMSRGRSARPASLRDRPRQPDIRRRRTAPTLQPPRPACGWTGARRAWLGGGEASQGFARGHGRRAAGCARQHHRLRQARQREFGTQRGRRGGERGHAGRDRVGDADGPEAAQLLAHRRPHGQIARMQPRHVLPCRMGGDEFGDDGIEIEWRGVDDARAGWTVRQDFFGHQRAGIEADRAAADQVAPAQGQQVWRTGAGAYEVDGHGRNSGCCVRAAIAQVARRSVDTTRG
jgi:hypothetical protein